MGATKIYSKVHNASDIPQSCVQLIDSKLLIYK